VAVLVALVFLIGGCAYNSARDAPKPGYIAVCQTGGPFEGDSGTCGVKQPGSRKSFLGFSNNLREYPATQRNFTLGNAQDAEGGPITLTTKDGKRVAVSIQWLFTLDRNQIEQFYKSYGLKEYGGKPVYENEGWVNFLKAEFSQVAAQSLKGLVLTKTGAQLNPAFAAAEAGDQAVNFDSLDSEGNLAQLEVEAGDRFASELESTLGGKFFTNIRVSSLRVDPPGAVQESVDAAVAAKGREVSAIADGKAAAAKAKADATVQVTAAKAERDAQILKAQGLRAQSRAYADSPEKAQVDAIAALPDSLTTLIIGEGGNTLLNLGK
jgi:regulator of protease activity HflC (stomatin/prohibitin superfamily)